MPEGLSPETVRHVANLARLNLTEEEVTLFSEQLTTVAGHFADVEALDTTDVPPATHAQAITNVFREDERKPGLTPDELLAAAPDAEDGRFRVPRILGEE